MNKVAVIHVTDKCNLNCPYCLWVLKERTGSEMSMGEFITIVDYLKENEYTDIMLQSEGEVLCHSRYRDLMNYARNAGLRIDRLITNGLLLDTVFDLLPELRVTVSLDACTPESYARHRGGTQKQFDKVVSNIRKAVLVEERQKINVNYVITSENYTEIIAAIRFCEQLGVDSVRFHQYNPKIMESKVLFMNDKVEKLFIDLFHREDFDIQIKINLRGVSDNYVCSQLSDDRLTIGLGGYLSPCCHIHTDKKYGTYREPSIVYEDFKMRKEVPDECIKCPRYNLISANFNVTSKTWYRAGV